ncbi:MAG TPA: cell wall-binding repeat-containing protein, partial [Coriobacteriia bacterium]
MARRTFRLTLLGVLLLGLAFPASLFAAQPPSGPIEIVRDGFEGSNSHRTIDPLTIIFPPTAWWAPTTRRHAAGSYGLWCAGSVPATWPLSYPQGTAGEAVYNVPELANYYSSALSFKYTMPSLGMADTDSFFVGWRQASGFLWDYHHYPLTADNVWSSQSHPMATTGGIINLTRTPGVIKFQFIDQVEGAGQTIFTGQGATIDDVVISGYKYGPIRLLNANRSSGHVSLTWTKPSTSTNNTAADTRTIGYRVWRAPQAYPDSWTELTAGRLAAPGFTDNTPLNVPSQYFVQAWDPTAGGTPDGYGDPSGSVVAVAGTVFSVTYENIEGPAGGTRFDTAIAAVEKAFPAGSGTVVLAWGRNFPDALGAS